MDSHFRGVSYSIMGVVAFAFLWSSPVRAQQAPQAAVPAAGELEEVIVTARRIEERLQDVPISITVYNEEQLSNRNIVNSTDLAAYTPSLAVNGRYGPDKSSFAIRGFSQDLNTLPTVGVYFADVVAPRLTSNITSGNGAGVGSMFDLQNVQVLKGPQGTLFGRNTTGGAVLLVPQKPTDRLEGYVEGTTGNYSARRIQAVLNVPVSDILRVRMGVDRNVRDGYVRSRSGIGPRDFHDVDYWAARLSVDVDLTPDLENYAIFTYSRSDTHGTVGKMAFCNRHTVPGSAGYSGTGRAAECAQLDAENAAGYGYYDVENSDPGAFVLGSQWQAINTTTWKASDTLTIKNIASYGQAKESYSFNIDGDNIAFPFVTTYPGPSGGQGKQRTTTEELQLQGRTSDDRLSGQAGGYLEISDPIDTQQQWTAVFSNCSDVYTFKCTPLAFSPTLIVGSIGVAHNNYHYRNYGLYAQGTYKLSDQFRVTAGVRNTWDWEREDADNIRVVPSPTGPIAFSCSRAVTPTPNPGAALVTSGACGAGRSFVQGSHKPTWLIDLDYKPIEDLLIYAKYARGYRGGGVNEANVGAETWKPETVDDYELGAKTSFHGVVPWTLNIDGFWNDFTNQQASVTIPQCVAGNPGCTNPAFTGINGIQNVGKSRLRGVEGDGSAVFGDFRFDFGYAYLDAKVIGVSTPICDTTRFLCSQASFLSTPGTTLPFAPKNRITVTGTYTLPLSQKVGKISIGATFTHTDSQFSSHSDDAAFAAGAIPFNASLDPATDLLTLNLNWNSIGGYPIDLGLFATNVTDQKYYVASTNSLSTTGADFIILGEPRMYGVRVKVHAGR